jgi:hypothetical protein
VAKQMGESRSGESRSVWTPHHWRVIKWKQTHHWWMGECVAKPPSTRDWIHHHQCIEWESFVTSLETWTPFRSFPLAVSPPLALARGFQGTGGGRGFNQSKICGQTPIIYVLWPNTTTMPTHICKLVITFYSSQFVAQKLDILCCPNKMVLA